MSLSAYTIWEVLPASGSDSTTSGGFDPSQTAGMATDGAATSATGNAPVFSSASYNFVSGDVGAYVYIASGTNWVPGWYKVASVASNKATLNATAAQFTLANGQLSTAAGCASTASPTGATWTIDYSQQASAQFSYTDLAIGTTTTHLTSSGNPFGVQQVGNLVQVTSGTGFTAGWYCITSISSGAAVMDRAVGTASSTSGHGYQGGAAATISTNLLKSSGAICVQGNIIWLSGTLTVTASILWNVSSSACKISLRGYGTYRGDGTHGTITTATNSVHLIEIEGVTGAEIGWLTLSSTAGTPGHGVYAAGGGSVTGLTLQDCKFTGFDVGVYGDFAVEYLFSPLYMIECEVTACTTFGVYNSGITVLDGCYFHGNGGDDVNVVSNQAGGIIADGCAFSTGSAGSGINYAGTATVPIFSVKNCNFYNKTADGIRWSGANSVTSFYLLNNIFYGNGGFGINNTAGSTGAAAPAMVLVQRNNAFGSNTSGNRGATTGPAIPADVTDIALTADPWTSPSTGNFILNSTSGGGTACTGTGWQSTIL
jgi:hypothetical protein